MKVLIAIDSFKNSFSSIQAAQTVGNVLTPLGFVCTKIAIADGGEGTAEAFLASQSQGKWMDANVHDPLGHPLHTRYAWVPDRRLAVIDTAAASGLQFVELGDSLFTDPTQASSAGTGELIMDAINHGAKTIVIGLGGSGVTDAGIGLLGVLGARFYDVHGKSLPPKIALLSEVMKIDISHMITQNIHLVACADVDTPLTGPEGAVHMFGPQKGLLPGKVANRIEKAISHFGIIADPLEHGQHPGDGAAGGIGFALRLLGAAPLSGFDFISNAVNLQRKINTCDLVITGEGKLDEQSFHGKVPTRIAKLALASGKPCIGIFGQVSVPLHLAQESGFTTVFSSTQDVTDLHTAMIKGRSNLAKLVERIAPLLLRQISV